MAFRALLVAVLACGLCGVASAQPGEEDFGGFSDQDGSPRERGQDRGQGGRRGGREGFRRGGPRPNPLFEALDIDGDNMISARELRRAVANLKKLDEDGDGNISLEEVTPARRGPEDMVARIMENDTNKDGKLTPDELPEQFARMLTGADLNADGAFDRQEIEQAMANFRDRFRRGPGGPGRVEGGEGPGGRSGFRGGGFGNADDMTKQLMAGDSDGDGVLTPDEVPRQSLAMLRNADTNGDGVLDAREVRAAMEDARARFDRFRQGGGEFGPGGRGRFRPE